MSVNTFLKQSYALLVLLTLFNFNITANDIRLIQVLTDGVNAIDGLDNPRQVKLSANDTLAFVTSGDDNSLAIFELKQSLTQLQVFKTEELASVHLTGASSLATLNDGNAVAVTSFYDGALSIFSKGDNNRFNLTQTFTDNIDYKRAFASNKAIGDEDSYGLLGAWDLAKAFDEKQIFVTGYKSNAIAIFDISQDSKVVFRQKITSIHPHIHDFGNPVSLALSKNQNLLVISGYENNTLTVLSNSNDGQLRFKQKIKNNFDGVTSLVNPQKVLFSTDGKHLYVASAGGNAILIFELVNNQYVFMQSIKNSDIGGSGLNGVGSLALSKNGKRLFAAGELDSGLLLFEVTSQGKLNFMKNLQLEKHKIEGVTSISVSDNDAQILLTLGKLDSLYLLDFIHQQN